MIRILGIAGSLRKKSYNAALLRAFSDVSIEDFAVETATIAGIPIYDGDLEAQEGLPAAVSELKDRIAGADGLLLITPEYNHSIPGPLKNAIDWLSRPPADIRRVFHGLPVALAGASPGLGGTRMSQAAWLPVLRALGMQPWCGMQLYVAGAAKVFDEAGKLMDESITERVQSFVKGFGQWVRENPRRR